MDILYLLDRLEEALASGQHVPFTARSLIDEQEALDILDQIRVAIPEEVKQARRVLSERDSILAEATEKAERLQQEASLQLRERLDEHALVRDAERRAEEVRQEVLREVEQMRREADAYAYRVFHKLHAQLETLTGQVEQGLRNLEAQSDEVAAQAEPADDTYYRRGERD